MRLTAIVSAIVLSQVGQGMHSRWVVEGAETDKFENVRSTLEGLKLLGMLSSDNDMFWTRDLIGWGVHSVGDGREGAVGGIRLPVAGSAVSGMGVDMGYSS